MNVQNLITSIIPLNEKYLVGFADMFGLLTYKFTGYRYAIIVARSLDGGIIDSINCGPNNKYLDHYNDVNKELSENIIKISLALEKKNVSNIPIKPTVEDNELGEDYFKTLTIPYSHKMAATRAGLGWIGKTDLLVTEKFGPRIRLASILLHAKICDVGDPIEAGKCGDCDVCVKKCPAQAANGKQWNVKVNRDEFYNAFKCREKCRELSMKNMNEKISLCGICVSVCPKGMKVK